MPIHYRINYRWLAIAETGSVAIAVIGTVLTVLTGNSLYALVPLTLGLVLGWINRRWQIQQVHRRAIAPLQRTQRQILENIQGLQRIQHTLAAIAIPRAGMPPQEPDDSNDSGVLAIQQAIAQLESQSEGLAASLSQVIDYINRALPANKVAQWDQLLLLLGEHPFQVAEPLLFPTPDRSLGYLDPSVASGSPDALSEDTISEHGLEQAGKFSPELQDFAQQFESLSDDEKRGPKPQEKGQTGTVTPEPSPSPSPAPTVQPFPLDPWETPPLFRPEALPTIRTWQMGPMIQGHTSWVSSLLMTPDNQRLITSSYDKTIGVWALDTGERLQTLTGHEGRVCSVAVSPDGRLLASGGHDRQVRLWQLDRGDGVGQLDELSYTVRSLAFSPHVPLLVSGNAGGEIHFWNPTTGEQLLSLQAHTGAVRGLVFHPIESVLVSCGDDGLIQVWNPETGRLLDKVTWDASSLMAIAFCPSGQALVAGGSNKAIQLWDWPTRQQKQTLVGHTGPITTLAIHRDNRTLVSGGADGQLKLWDDQTGRFQRNLLENASSCLTVAFSTNGQYLASGDEGGTIHLWHQTIQEN